MQLAYAGSWFFQHFARCIKALGQADEELLYGFAAATNRAQVNFCAADKRLLQLDTSHSRIASGNSGHRAGAGWAAGLVDTLGLPRLTRPVT